jgi:hypothetical protein
LNKRQTTFIIVGIVCGIIAIFLVIVLMGTLEQGSRIKELDDLIAGKISTFQYCSHRGKAAVDDALCKEFNLLYGPQ